MRPFAVVVFEAVHCHHLTLVISNYPKLRDGEKADCLEAKEPSPCFPRASVLTVLRCCVTLVLTACRSRQNFTQQFLCNYTMKVLAFSRKAVQSWFYNF